MSSSPPKPATGASQGTQSIDRTILLLKLVSYDPVHGMRLSDLSEWSHLPIPTTRRILKRLMELRMVVQDAGTKRYFLGSLAFEMGVAAGHKMPVFSGLQAMVRRLSEASEDTVYLSIRSGTEVMILERSVGKFPVQALTYIAGQRAPMGSGAASVALLGALPDEEMLRIVAENEPYYKAIGISYGEALLEEVAFSRKHGYLVKPSPVTEEVWGLGVVVPVNEGVPYAALTISMIKSRMTPERQKELLKMVRKELDAYIAHQ